MSKTIDEKYEDMLKKADSIATMNNAEKPDDISNKDIEILAKALDGTKEEEMETYVPTESDMELEKVPHAVYNQVDPTTGKIVGTPISEEEITKSSSNVDDIIDSYFDQDPENIEITEDAITEALKSVFPTYKENDTFGLLEAAKRYQKKEKISYYNILPDSIKFEIDKLIGGSNVGYASQKEARKYVAETLLDTIVSNAYSDYISIDFSKALENTYKELYDETKDTFSEFNNDQRDMFMNHMVKKAEEETDPEKAKLFMSCHDMFEESYTFERIMNKYKSGMRIKKIELEKFKKTCNNWIMKYQDHKMIINNVYDTYPLLVNYLKVKGYKYTDDQIKTFIIVFLKYTDNMSPDKVDEHILMYFFIKNILGLKYHNDTDEKENAFYNKVLENVVKALDIIKERVK